MERALKEKEEELEIYKSGMDQTLLELNELRMVRQKQSACVRSAVANAA